MTKVKNFSENVENNLVRLGHEVAKRREMPGGAELPERNLVKESINSLARFDEVPPAKAGETAAPSAPVPAPAPGGDFLPGYLADSKDEGLKKSVERLLQVAAEEDIVKAVMEAKKYPPFVEDAFHDALIDKFLPELKKRGIVK
jgi:hypothetical protein